MRVKVTKRRNGKYILELGYYKKRIILNDILELIQISSDLNAEISKLFSPKPTKRKHKKQNKCNTMSQPHAQYHATDVNDNSPSTTPTSSPPYKRQEQEPSPAVGPQQKIKTTALGAMVST